MPIKAGTFLSRTTTGNDVVSAMGFTPLGIIIAVTNATAFDDTTLSSTDSSSSYTISDGTTTRCTSTFDDDNAASSATGRGWTTTVALTNASGTMAMEGTLTLGADGFTINWTTVDGAAHTVCWWAYGGAGLAAKVLLFDRATTGSAGVTGAGFAPKGLFGIGQGYGTPPSVAASDGGLILGFSDDDATEGTIGSTLQDGANPANDSMIFGSAGFLQKRNAANNAADTTIVITSNDADGFTYNATTHPASSRYYAVLCFGGADLAAVETVVLTANTTTGANTQTMTGFPWDPDGGVIIGGSQTSFTNASHARMTFSAFDANLNQWGTLTNSVDNVTPINALAGASNTSVLLAYNSTDDIYDAVGNITAKDNDSVDIGWDAGKIATQFVWYTQIFDLDEPPVVTGALAGTFGGLTATMTGTVVSSTTGTMAGALGGLTGTMAGTVDPAGVFGTMAGPLGGLTGTMQGTIVPLGGMLGAFGGLTATMVGTRVVSGVMVASFGGLSALVNVPFTFYAWGAKVQPSHWRADLKK